MEPFIGDLHQACYNAGITKLEVTNFENEILNNASYRAFETVK